MEYRQRSCLLNCNREVTCIRQRPCLYVYEVDGGQVYLQA